MHYKKLRVYQLAEYLQSELYKELIHIPHYWTINEVDQAIRSSSSITSNIVEGHGRRFYPKDYFRFLSIAMASSDETQSHIITINKKGFISDLRFNYYLNKYKTLSIQLLNFMTWLRKKYHIKTM